MNKKLKAVYSFIKLDFASKRDVLIITFFYLKTSSIVRVIPLRKYFNRYFLNQNTNQVNLAAYNEKIRLINQVIKRLPGKHTCLKECIVVHLFFKRMGIYVPLYLGINTKDTFLAHAWYDKNKSGGFNQLSLKMEKRMKKNKKEWVKPSYKSLSFSQTLGGSIQGINETATSFGFNGTIS